MSKNKIEKNSDKIRDLIKRREKLILGGGQKRIDRQHAQGKYTARERINMLFDEGTFVETNSFVQHRCRDFGMDKRRPDGDAVITGHGTVDGRLVYVYAQDFTVIGGTIAEMHVHKINKLYSAAMKTGAPVVGLFDSGGARIQEGLTYCLPTSSKTM